MHRRRLPSPGITAILLIAGIAASSAGHAQTTAPSYSDSKEGLTQLFTDILAAAAARDRAKVLGLTKPLMLAKPADWFNAHFSQEKAKKLTAEYETELKDIDQKLGALLLSLKDVKQLGVEVDRIESPDNPKAKPYQILALAEMQPVEALYTVTMSKPDSSGRVILWSFVYHDGGFRLLGKMRAVND